MNAVGLQATEVNVVGLHTAEVDAVCVQAAEVDAAGIGAEQNTALAQHSFAQNVLSIKHCNFPESTDLGQAPPAPLALTPQLISSQNNTSSQCHTNKKYSQRTVCLQLFVLITNPPRTLSTQRTPRYTGRMYSMLNN